MNGALTRDQQLRRRVEDALVGLGFAEIYTPSLRPDDDTPWKLPEPISVELHRAPHLAAPEPRRGRAPQRRRGLTRDRALRDRARLPAGRRPSGRRRRPWPGSPRAASCTSRASSRRCIAALKAEPTFSRVDAIRSSIRASRATTDAGILGELHPRELDGEWGVFELDLRTPVRRRRRPGHLPRRHHLSGRPAGHRRRRRRGDPGRRARRRGPRGGRRGASRDPRLRRLPRRPGRPGQEVGRLLGRLPGVRPDARRRGRGAPAQRDRRRARASASAPSCAA